MTRLGLSVALVVALSACASNAPRELDAERPLFTFLFSPHRHIEQDPCGCSFNLLGGPQREHAFLTKERARGGQAPVYLAYGHSFVPMPDKDGPTPLLQELAKADLPQRQLKQIEIWNFLGLTALAPGGTDFLLGKQKLAELRDKCRFPWISANARDSATRKLLWPATFVAERAGRRVVVTAISEPPGEGTKLPAEFTLDSPETALKEVVSQLGANDLLVVLTPFEDAVVQKLAEKFPRAAIWAGGADRDALPAVAQETAERVFVSGSARGRHLVRFDFTPRAPFQGWYADRKAVITKSVADRLAREIAEREAELAKVKKTKDKKRLEAEIADRKHYRATVLRVPVEKRPELTELQYEFVVLDATYDGPPDAQLAKILGPSTTNAH